MIETIKQAAESGVAGIAVQPYIDPSDWTCKECGLRVSIMERIFSRMKGTVGAAARFGFCPGGKEPQESTGFGEALATGKMERLNSCAGLMEKHLHVRCICCGADELMWTKGHRG